MTERVKFGYLSYDDMLLKIETGELNEYDVIYSKDRLLTYLVSEDLQPIELRSRVYIFNSINEAESFLNNASDTYVGQIVSILYKDKYRGYIVNKNNEVYKVSPLYENPDIINYDELGNRPIINLIGTLDSPISITTLSSGIYKVKGQYKIIENEETIYLSADGDLFLIEVSNTDKLIKRFTKDTIQDYIISEDNSITKKTYVTDEYLLKNGYAKTEYVDGKIAALEQSIKSDIEGYVKEIIEDVITEQVDEIIDERLDKKINENIQAIPNTEVTKLF
jgi:hypothetical protein